MSNVSSQMLVHDFFMSRDPAVPSKLKSRCPLTLPAPVSEWATLTVTLLMRDPGGIAVSKPERSTDEFELTGVRAAAAVLPSMSPSASASDVAGGTAMNGRRPDDDALLGFRSLSVAAGRVPD